MTVFLGKLSLYVLIVKYQRHYDLFLAHKIFAVCFVCLGYFLRTRASPIQRSFQGCMQLIQVDDQLADLTAVEQGRMGAFENVSLDMCAIIDRSEPTLLPLLCLSTNTGWQWLSGAADWDCGCIPTGSICPGGRIRRALPALSGVDLLHSSTSMADEKFNQRADAVQEQETGSWLLSLDWFYILSLYKA